MKRAWLVAGVFAVSACGPDQSVDDEAETEVRLQERYDMLCQRATQAPAGNVKSAEKTSGTSIHEEGASGQKGPPAAATPPSPGKPDNAADAGRPSPDGDDTTIEMAVATAPAQCQSKGVGSVSTTVTVTLAEPEDILVQAFLKNASSVVNLGTLSAAQFQRTGAGTWQASVTGMVTTGNGASPIDISSARRNPCTGVWQGPRDAIWSRGHTLRVDCGTTTPTSLAPSRITYEQMACKDGAATVRYAGSVRTTKSTAPVSLTFLNGIRATPAGKILGQTFQNGVATFSGTVVLPDGSHSVRLAMSQTVVESGEWGPGRMAGQNGPPIFTEAQTLTVRCAPPKALPADACANEPFGRPEIKDANCKCQKGGSRQTPLHFRSSLGESATLSITGPKGYSHQSKVKRSGNSCNYQYNWTFPGVAGTYTFKATNGRQVFTWTEDFCK